MISYTTFIFICSAGGGLAVSFHSKSGSVNSRFISDGPWHGFHKDLSFLSSSSLKDAFEGCKADGGALSSQSHMSAFVATNSSLLDAAGDCGADEFVLEEEGIDSVSFSCCPAGSLSCGGCAKHADGKCAKCVGGYHLDQERCVTCADSLGWVDKDGKACPDTACSSVKHHGLSSNEACCKCGGGQRAATAFSYRAVSVELGAKQIPNTAGPIPRTAQAYSVNMDCELGKYGLSIDGSTGRLVLAGCESVGCGKKEHFEVSCEVTAHQAPELNATATLLVHGVSFGYASNPLVVSPGVNVFKPIVAVTGAQIACVPKNAEEWLKVDATGTLTATKDAVKSHAGLTGAPQFGVVGGRCEVKAMRGATKVSTSVSVLFPQAWKSFNYPRLKLYASLGEAASPMKVQAVNKDLLRPSRFSAHCQSQQSINFAFDTLTGVATVNGHIAFTLDDHGTLHVTPSKGLEKTIDDVVDDGVLRKRITLTCRIYGHYSSWSFLDPGIVKSPKVSIQLRDNACWVQRTANFVGQTAVSSSASLKACWQKCREKADCTDFRVSGGKCYFMQGVCIKGEQCPLKRSRVHTKIPNCGERTSCLHVTDTSQEWQSGSYCPAGETMGTPVYLKEGNTLPDTLYLTQYSRARDGAKSGCADGMYCIKQAAPKADFDDPESEYMELNGKVVQCLNANGDFIDKVFSSGSIGISQSVRVEITGRTCGEPNTTTTDDSGADDAEEDDAPPALIFDDPATPQAADHWMHPCECFPESWGRESPVMEESFEAVPPGSMNMFVPSYVEIVHGEFTCEDEHLIDSRIFLADDSTPDACDVLCKQHSCKYVWEGEVQSSKQCRLYKDCNTLVREPGAEGALKAVASASKKYCHIADPDRCWSVTGRRNLLYANLPSEDVTCSWAHLLSQCDLQLILGGYGVQECGRCSYQEVGGKAFNHKSKLPSEFFHGQKLRKSCWQGRFREVSVNGGDVSKALTCMSGTWIDEDGHAGLSNFACAACVQVVSAPYSQLDSRNKQELYFSQIMEIRFKAMTKTDRVLLRSGSLNGQLDSSPGHNPSSNDKPLLECQGDCDRDSDCSGILKCFQRSAYEQVPGCGGKGNKGWDYCYVPASQKFPFVRIGKTYQTDLRECQGHCSSDSQCYGSLKCYNRGGRSIPIPGCTASGNLAWNYCYDPSKLRAIDSSPGGDGKVKLKVCMGDCNSDSDCEPGLKCFQRDGYAKVTGCKGSGSKNYDYCYDPNFHTVPYRDRGSYSGRRRAALGKCEGDCDNDGHCASGLKCFQRDSGKDAPGCSKRPGSSTDVCYDPNAPTKGTLTSTKPKMKQCQGDCDSDHDCEAGLYCMQRDKDEPINGCSGTPKRDWDYCARRPTVATVSVRKPHPDALGECEGSCSTDAHCKSGLKCFKRNGREPVPGCEGGNVDFGYNYCYDPVKAKAAPTGAEDMLDYIGFVAEGTDEEKLLKATGKRDSCLEVVSSDGAGGLRGIRGARCGVTPKESQLISIGGMPQLLQEKFKDATLGLVPAPAMSEVSLDTGKVNLQDFVFEQDCEEHSLSSFGWSDADKDGKLEMYAACSQSSTLGSPTKKYAVLGGNLDITFTTCGSTSADTDDYIYYQFNSQARKQLGSKGRSKGAKDKFVLHYNEPFKQLKIWGSGSDGWKICRIKVGGEDIPTASLELNVPELPCWIDADGSDDCVTKNMFIRGNRMQQELAHARIECDAAQAISTIKKERSRFVYGCSYVAGLGTCTPGQTTQVDTSSGQLDALENVGVTCPPNEVLQSLVAEESVGGKWLRYRFVCCKNAGLPLSVDLTGRRFESSLQKFEGIYCPATRDASGRPKFERVHSFVASDKGTARSLVFKRDAMQWCIGNSCLSSPATHPLDAGFKDTSWEVVALSNFDGQFEGKGAAKAGGGASPKRKKPELIQFGATRPEYREECRDDVTPGTEEFDLEEMNKRGMTLSEGNPCKLVAGAWIPQEPEQTPFGLMPQPPQPEGSSYWTTHGYSDSDGEYGAGTTYDSVRACGDREIARDLKMAGFEDYSDEKADAIDLYGSIAQIPCGLAPNIEVAPFGAGVEWDIPDLCGNIAGHVMDIKHYVNSEKQIHRNWKMAKNDNADCNSLQHGLSRIFCDLHCIRDAVKAGDEAILRSLEGAVGIVGQNTDLLLEYYAGTLQDSLDKIQEAQEESQSGSLLLQAKAMRGNLKGMFVEMKRALSSARLNAGSKATVARAIKSFETRFTNAHQNFFQLGANATSLMTTLLQESSTLKAVIDASSSVMLPAAATAASRTAEAVEQLQSVLKTRVHLLGVFKDSAQSAKARQELLSRKNHDDNADIVNELRTSSARSMLLDLDRSWWFMRSKLDSYLEAAEVQASAYDAAFQQLDGYTSECRVSFADLKASYDAAMRAETSAHAELRDTWNNIVQQIGLMAAKLKDGAAFVQFARLDASSVSVAAMEESERVAICKARQTDASLLQESATMSTWETLWQHVQSFFFPKAASPHAQAGAKPSFLSMRDSLSRDPALAATRAAVRRQVSQGFTGQTWQQVVSIFGQVPMLRDRFASGGMRAPGMDEVLQAWSRIASARQEALDFVAGDELVSDVLSRIHRSGACKGDDEESAQS
eukprot:TRINITY_DN288_c1_g1_i4.p1 TRINITY_DN288_c1_g1~~TRINITY_DN288_c1_g1_i4.p1  ORF type:complete len:2624 (-),score=354.57 TRINITY_DN288_c1_g1_i4:129-7931(-)